MSDRLKYYLRRMQLRYRDHWWQKHRGESRSVRFQVQDGVKMNLYLDSELCRLIYCKHFEHHERCFLNAFLKPGDIFVDIGLFSLIAGRLVGKSGKVFAFEPSKQTFERLLSNIALNQFDHVVPHRLALSDQTGEIEMTESTDGFDAWNSLAAPAMGEQTRKSLIHTTTWDDFSEQNDLDGKVAMMKIDVEGWEARVLCGASRTLSRPDAPVLQVEFTDKAAQIAGSSCKEIYNLLESYGYQMHVFDADNKKLRHDPLRQSYPNANLFAVKKPDGANLSA